MCTLNLVERSKPLDLPKNPTALEVIELDNFIDAFPINKRLPKFEISMLDAVEKELFAEAKQVVEEESSKKATTKK